MTFEVGDYVLCVSSSYSSGGPKEGNIYRVLSTSDMMVGVFCPEYYWIMDEEFMTGLRPNWPEHYFRRVPETRLLKIFMEAT